MRVFRYLAGHKAALLLVFVLLVAQAACELSLPRLTSSIVDVGIQQSGVEHVAAEGLTSRSHDLIAMLLSGEDARIFEQAYEPGDAGDYVLTAFGREHLADLDRMMELPLVAIHDQASLTATPVDLEQMLIGYESGAITHEDVDAWASELRERLDAPTRSLMPQKAIASAIAEYSLLGYDLMGIQMGYLLRCGGAMLGLTLCAMAFAILVGLIAARTGSAIGRDLRRSLFARVVSFSEAEVGRFSAASLITRGTNDIQQVQMVSIMLMRMVLYAPILALGGIVMVVATNAMLGWVVVAALGVLLVVMLVLFRVTMPRFKLMQRLIDKVNLVSREMLEGMPVIRAFDRQGFEEARFEEASSALRATQLFTNRAMSFMMPTMMLLMNLTSIAIIWFGGIQVGDGVTQTGDLIAFITYSMVIIMGFLMIGMVSIMLPRASVASERVDEVIACEPSIVDPVGPEVRVEGGVPLLAFEDVSFAYDEGSEPVLEHVSFRVEEGEDFAIIGSTGSGKTTILKLIERFFDAGSGAILVDGRDVRSWPLAELRAQFGYVPQRAFLFAGSVDTNVAYGDEGMPEHSVLRALETAQAASFVSEMPGGTSAPIAQGGTNVSGGQRQRLAIARAIASEHRVLLFDDSFSALDYLTDARLRHALEERFPATTRITVAQRIATVMGADRILVLEEGRVVGCGTHAQLMDACAEYRAIALSQLSAEEAGRMGGAS